MVTNMDNKSKYDYDKLEDILKTTYYQRNRKSANKTSMAELINCVNDAFMDEWRRQILEEDKRLQAQANEVFEKAQKMIEQLDAAAEKTKESGIQDTRVIDALKAYMMIVDMSFDTPQQKLQNIQNASYFIWALYASGGSDAANIFFKDAKNATSVKDEPEYKTKSYRDVAHDERGRRI